MSSQLEQIKQYTTVVADTGDFHQLAQFTPRDATTNPSLILKSVQKPEYRPLLERVARDHAGQALPDRVDRLLVAFGLEILKIVPGRVSTEVDARLSFDTAGTLERARQLMALYAAQGVGPERVLIKIAATWEGIQAARVLEKDGVHTNLTLLFSLPQAVACAQAGVRLISPFVGRIYDWHKKAAGAQWDEAAHAGELDPGVRSVTAIFNHFKKFDIATQVMGASFRNVGQILALAGCDLLTISPELLGQLQAADAPVFRRLDPQRAHQSDAQPLNYDEPALRLALNEDAMASEKLAEGIRLFVADARKLDALLAA